MSDSQSFDINSPAVSNRFYDEGAALSGSDEAAQARLSLLLSVNAPINVQDAEDAFWSGFYHD